MSLSEEGGVSEGGHKTDTQDREKEERWFSVGHRGCVVWGRHHLFCKSKTSSPIRTVETLGTKEVRQTLGTVDQRERRGSVHVTTGKW